jgi:PAS domain S-box-containing protein
VESVRCAYTADPICHSIWVDVTTRKEAQRSLIALKNTLEQRVAEQTAQIQLQAKAISSLAEGVLITTSDLDAPGPEIIFINEAISRITGYSEAELVGKSPRILQGPATNRETTRRIKTELSAGKNCFAEVVNYTKDGRLYDAELFISPLFDAEGHITHFVSIQRDITARKETERRLREREQRFSALVDATSDVVYRMSPDWTKMLYLEGREFIPDTHSPSPAWLERYIPADHQPRVMAAIERAIDTKSKFELEHPVLRVDGTLGWTHSRAIPIVDEAGEILEWFGAASDITPRKNAEAAQREREERLQAVLNTAYDAIVCFDHDGLITDVNAAAETIFGYAGHQFIGQHVSLILPPPCLQTPGLPGEPQDEDPLVARRHDCIGMHRNGNAFPTEVAISHIEHLQLYTAVIRDVSERKRLQREVLMATEEEQRRIGQDLHDSAQQELVGLGMIAQTLLDSISRSRCAEGDPEMRASCDMLQRITTGLDRVHREVQNVARGLVPLLLGKSGLETALRELAKRTSEIKRVHCSFHTEGEVDVADDFVATHLYRIAQEAVANALKHAAPEGIMIRLGHRNGVQVLEVADDGSGFSGHSDDEGVGLKTMRYRANLIGARLSISTCAESGTLISCTIPCHAANGLKPTGPAE